MRLVKFDELSSSWCILLNSFNYCCSVYNCTVNILSTVFIVICEEVIFIAPVAGYISFVAEWIVMVVSVWLSWSGVWSSWSCWTTLLCGRTCECWPGTYLAYTAIEEISFLFWCFVVLLSGIMFCDKYLKVFYVVLCWMKYDMCIRNQFIKCFL